jgi:hypothetical protein
MRPNERDDSEHPTGWRAGTETAASGTERTNARSAGNQHPTA